MILSPDMIISLSWGSIASTGLIFMSNRKSDPSVQSTSNYFEVSKFQDNLQSPSLLSINKSKMTKSVLLKHEISKNYFKLLFRYDPGWWNSSLIKISPTLTTVWFGICALIIQSCLFRRSFSLHAKALLILWF